MLAKYHVFHFYEWPSSIYEANEGELSEDTVVKDSLTTVIDGKEYKTKYYNLDVVISGVIVYIN